MEKRLLHLIRNIKVQLLLLSIAGGIVLRLFVPDTRFALLRLLGEVLQFFVIIFFVINLTPAVRRISRQPIILLSGMLAAGGVIAFLLHISEPSLRLFGFAASDMESFLGLFAGTGFHLLLILPGAFLFAGLRELFFLKQRRKIDIQFNAMIFFFGLAGLTAFTQKYEGYSFLHYTFFSVALLLVVYNSAKISWIAFLSKREKRNVIFLSIAFIVLFIWNLILFSNEQSEQMMLAYSPGVRNFILLIQLYGLIYTGFLFFTSLFHLPTAEAIDRKSQELESLQYVSRLLNQVFDPNELASTVTELAVSVCASDAAWIILEEDVSESLIAPRNITAENARLINKTILPMYLRAGREIMFIDLSASAKSEPRNDDFSFAAVVPLKRHNTLTGYLITTKKALIPFDEDDRSTLETFAYYVAIAFENSRLFAESLERERLSSELDVAREMQRKLIPEEVPQRDKLEIAASFIPAFEVGGDYYDFFNLPDGNLAFIIADVAGKGIGAAFIMAEIKGIFESLSTLLSSPKEILVKANVMIKGSLSKNQFITAIFGVVNTTNGEVIVCRAGHPPLILIGAETVTEVVPRGIGLGLSGNTQFEEILDEHRFRLMPGETLVLFTDGITESMNVEMSDFGLPRLTEIVRRSNSTPLHSLQQEILGAVARHAERHVQHDDITLLILRWK